MLRIFKSDDGFRRFKLNPGKESAGGQKPKNDASPSEAECKLSLSKCVYFSCNLLL
jgi:hypothetical protein